MPQNHSVVPRRDDTTQSCRSLSLRAQRQPATTFVARSGRRRHHTACPARRHSDRIWQSALQKRRAVFQRAKPAHIIHARGCIREKLLPPRRGPATRPSEQAGRNTYKTRLNMKNKAAPTSLPCGVHVPKGSYRASPCFTDAQRCGRHSRMAYA